MTRPRIPVALALLLLTFLVRAAPARAARTIAIAYFDNNTGKADLDPLRKGLADMLITDLGSISSLQIVEREKLNQVMEELKLSKSKFIDPKTAQKLGKGLAAEFIMTGSYIVSGETMRIDARVVQVQSGKVAASEKVEGKKDEFFSIEKELVEILVKTLDLKLSMGEKGKLRESATQSYDAWQKYSAGLDAKDRGDETEARRLFQAALDADPNYKAAKNATERLKVIFSRQDTQKAAEAAKMIKALDPKSPDFGKQVDDLLQQLSDQSDLGQVQKKVALLLFLAERDLAPTGPGGFARLPLEVNGLLSRFIDAPDAGEMIPPVCEYLISRYPKDVSAPGQCKVYLKTIDALGKIDPAMKKKMWDDKWAAPTLDWEIALKATMPDMRRLFKIYAKKVKR